MRALHVVTLHTPTHDFGGPTRVALNLCGGLRAAGEQAALVALGDGFPAGPLPREVDGVPARLFPARHVLPRFEVSGITSPSMLAGAPALLRSADVVHVHLMRDLVTLPMALLAARMGRPLVLQTHGMIDPTHNRVARAVDVLGLRWVLKHADAVLHLTDTERELTRAVVGPPATAPAMAPAYRLVNGVAPQAMRPPAPAGRPPTVLYCARIQEGKRPQDFVAAMPTVLAKYPHARFVMAGPDTGALAGDMLALARSLGVGHALEYIGALDHAGVLARLRSSDVYVLPSVKDAFSVSVLEALSVGLPVVVTRTNGLAPEIAASGAGRLVDSAPGDPENGTRVGRAVLELLDPAASAAASEAAWRLARASFTLDAVVDTLRGLYERVSGPHLPGPRRTRPARGLRPGRRPSAARAS
ncbi:glycosyltransferase [Streptomyces axinellae]|uniref:D-inositol 3-phosphate glycosyltransferase n=1 Tax=Streptomyces axinellae TaxID=552788 RepID=A0ABN3PPW4_9ACTN